MSPARSFLKFIDKLVTDANLTRRLFNLSAKSENNDSGVTENKTD